MVVRKIVTADCNSSFPIFLSAEITVSPKFSLSEITVSPKSLPK